MASAQGPHPLAIVAISHFYLQIVSLTLLHDLASKMFSYSIHRLRPRTNATLSLPNYKFHSNLFHPITSPIKTLNSHTKNATTPRATFHHHRSKNSQDKFHLIMPPGKTPIRRRSTLDIDFAMDKQPPPAPGGIFNVVFIGAGGINFGSKSEGAPWNHSFRLEHKV